MRLEKQVSRKKSVGRIYSYLLSVPPLWLRGNVFWSIELICGV